MLHGLDFLPQKFPLEMGHEEDGQLEEEAGREPHVPLEHAAPERNSSRRFLPFDGQENDNVGRFDVRDHQYSGQDESGASELGARGTHVQIDAQKSHGGENRLEAPQQIALVFACDLDDISVTKFGHLNPLVVFLAMTQAREGNIEMQGTELKETDVPHQY